MILYQLKLINKNFILKNEDGKTPLHVTVSNEHHKAADYLVNHGADIEAQDKKGKRALHFAIDSDSEKMTDALLKWGADPFALDLEERSYAQIAIVRQKWRTFKSLVK